MTLRQSGCLASAVCVLAAWGVIIALTWESPVIAAVFGAVFVVGVVLLVRHMAAVRRDAELARQQRESGFEGANKSGPSGVKDADPPHGAPPSAPGRKPETGDVKSGRAEGT